MLPYAFESSRLDSTEHRFICLFFRNRLFALPNRDLTTLDSSERSSFIQTPRYIAESFVGIPFIEIACFFLPFLPILKIADFEEFICISSCFWQKVSVSVSNDLIPKGDVASSRISSA